MRWLGISFAREGMASSIFLRPSEVSCMSGYARTSESNQTVLLFTSMSLTIALLLRNVRGKVQGGTGELKASGLAAQ